MLEPKRVVIASSIIKTERSPAEQTRQRPWQASGQARASVSVLAGGGYFGYVCKVACPSRWEVGDGIAKLDDESAVGCQSLEVFYGFYGSPSCRRGAGDVVGSDKKRTSRVWQGHHDDKRRLQLQN